MKFQKFILYILASLVFLGLSNEAFAQARVQIIHNSADPIAEFVDVYVNDQKPDILDNFEFRTATPYIDVTAGQDVIVKIADSSSTDENDQIIQTFNLGQLENAQEYVVFANGVIGEGFNNGNPGIREIAFNLFAVEGREAAATQGNFEFNVFHGVTDAPGVDIYTLEADDPAVDSLDYVESTGYVSLPANAYTFTLTAQGQENVVVGTYNVDVRDLADAAGVVFASGFLTPDDEQGGLVSELGFGLYVALPDGTVVELDNVLDNATARAQIIHNSALPAADTVDIYVNGIKLPMLDNFAFTDATQLLPIATDIDVVVTIAGKESEDVNDEVIQVFDLNELSANIDYVVMASGVAGTDFNNPDPGNRNIDLNLSVSEINAAANGDNQTDLIVFHGSTDAPAVDIYTDLNGTAVVEGLDYSDFSNYLELPTNVYTVSLTVANDANTVAGSYLADLRELAGGTAVVMASGFLTPGDEAGGLDAEKYGLKLWAVFTDGSKIELPNVSQAGIAEVQVVHNSSLPAAATVDIYVNGQKPDALNDLEYREATSFLDVPAGIPVVVSVNAANSTDVNNGVIATFDLGELDAEQRYYAIASGVAGENFQNGEEGRDISFNIFPTTANENSSTTDFAEFKLFHGVTDAPSIDVYSNLENTPFIDDLNFGEYTNFINLPINEYELSITATGDDNVVAAYMLDLNGLKDQSFLVFASGFLTPGDEDESVSSENYSFGLFAAFPNGSIEALEVAVPTAHVQVIHNSPLPAASVVDIYVNGEKSEALDNVAFREATPFVDVPANEAINITIANRNSTNQNDGVIDSFSLPGLDKGTKYVAIASGIAGEGFNNPDEENRNINLDIYPLPFGAIEDVSNTEFAVFHGVTDAPAVDIYTEAFESVLISDLDYGQFSNVFSIAPDSYELTITAAGDTNIVVGTWLANLNGLENEQYVVFASGFLSPEDEAEGLNKDDYGFGLFAAFRSGNVIPLEQIHPTTKLQVIHNSALPAANTVDIYVNGEKPDALNDIEFRTATSFLDVPAGIELDIVVAAATSTDPLDEVISTFELPALSTEEDYVLIASGVVGESFINPDSENRDITFNLYPITKPEQTNAENVEFHAFHGVTDAPAVDIYANELTGDPLIGGLDYGNYSDLISVPDTEYTLIVTPAGVEQEVISFTADLTGLAGQYATVFASGFLNINQQGVSVPAAYRFGLFAALEDGTVVSFEPIIKTAKVQIIHNSADPNATIVDVYLNGLKPAELNNLTFRGATPFLELPAEQDIEVRVTGMNSISPDDELIETFELGQLEDGKEYIVIVNGVVGEGFNNGNEGNRDISLQLYPIEGKSQATNSNEVEFLAFHGVTDAPAVDIYLNEDSTPLLSDFDYGVYSDYYSVDPAAYTLKVNAAGTEVTVNEYELDLTNAAGASGVLIASGFLTLEDEPGTISGGYNFGLFLVLADGTVLQLSPTTSVLDVNNNEGLSVYPNPASNILNIENNYEIKSNIIIFDASGKIVMSFDNINSIDEINVSNLPNGTYFLVSNSNENQKATSFIISK